MAKTVYEPGELDRVRNKLGSIDPNEAKRMAERLGGEVGVERSTEQSAEGAGKGRIVRKPRKSKGDAGGGSSGGGGGGGGGSSSKGDADSDKSSKRGAKAEDSSADDPKVPLKVNYAERLKMDKYAAQEEFDVKSSVQVFFSSFSFFKRPEDYVSSFFVVKRMPQYYQKIELLVQATRTMFPRNNRSINDQVQKASLFVFTVLDTIRYWDIEHIAADLAGMQTRSRNVKVSELANTLRAVYKPLFILERLNSQAHIKESFKFLYRFLYIENPIKAKDHYEQLIEDAVSAYEIIATSIRYLLYPLLLKMLSSNWVPYENFFLLRRNRFLAFLGAKDDDRIVPKTIVEKENAGDEATGDEAAPPAPDGETGAAAADGAAKPAEAASDGAAKTPEEAAAEAEAAPAEDAKPKSAAETAQKTREEIVQAAQKTLEQSLEFMETLFPKAGWKSVDEFPDIYPYFRSVFNLKKDYELIAPTDAMLQVVILMQVLQNLFFGLRYVSFTGISLPDTGERLDDALSEIVNNWVNHELFFEKEYLNRLNEYCRLLESSDRTSEHTKRLYNELQWTRRLFFFPYYHFDSLGQSPFPRNNTKVVYTDVRRLRKMLTFVAADVEKANKAGGAPVAAICDTINNPWDAYTFQVANPVSKRLNMLLGAKKRNNATLVSLSLTIVTILDQITNFDDSWAYPADVGPLFRSVKGEGIIPQFGVDERIDADLIFKDVIKEQRAAKKRSKIPLDINRAVRYTEYAL
ncbi:MAG: hypothetical protein LBS86_00950 [Treponema sp.]|jgi:hypothetical protein|nr:hypothetical protein [Treponema sp.]